jgi:hypothetical protein
MREIVRPYVEDINIKEIINLILDKQKETLIK